MLSIPDMALLGAAALIFFGPEQLPRVARKAGLFIRDMQNTSQSFIREMERAAEPPTVPYEPYEPSPAYEPPVDETPVPSTPWPAVTDPPVYHARTIDFDPPAPDPAPPSAAMKARAAQAVSPLHTHETAP